MGGKGTKEEDDKQAGSVQWLRAVSRTEQRGAKGPELCLYGTEDGQQRPSAS